MGGVPSIGDILMLSQLAWKIGSAFTSGRDGAPDEFQEVENELTNLVDTLDLLAETLDEDDGVLLSADNWTKAGINKVLLCCRQTLQDLNSFVTQCQEIKRIDDHGGQKGGRLQRSWKRVLIRNYKTVWWTTEGGNIQALRSILHMHHASISLTMQALKSKSLARLEQTIAPMGVKVDEVHDLVIGKMSTKIDHMHSLMLLMACQDPCTTSDPMTSKIGSMDEIWTRGGTAPTSSPKRGCSDISHPWDDRVPLRVNTGERGPDTYPPSPRRTPELEAVPSDETSYGSSQASPKASARRNTGTLPPRILPQMKEESAYSSDLEAHQRHHGLMLTHHSEVPMQDLRNPWTPAASSIRSYSSQQNYTNHDQPQRPSLSHSYGSDHGLSQMAQYYADRQTSSSRSYENLDSFSRNFSPSSPIRRPSRGPGSPLLLSSEILPPPALPLPVPMEIDPPQDAERRHRQNSQSSYTVFPRTPLPSSVPDVANVCEQPESPDSSGPVSNPRPAPPPEQKSLPSSGLSTKSSRNTSTDAQAMAFVQELSKNAVTLCRVPALRVEYTVWSDAEADFKIVEASQLATVLLVRRSEPVGNDSIRHVTSIWILSEDGRVRMQQDLTEDETIPYTCWGTFQKVTIRAKSVLKFHDVVHGRQPLETAETSWVNYLFNLTKDSEAFQSALMGKTLLLSVKTNKTMRIHDGFAGNFAFQEQMCALENLRVWHDADSNGVYCMLHYTPQFRYGYMVFYLNSTREQVRIREDGDRWIKLKGLDISIDPNTLRNGSFSKPLPSAAAISTAPTTATSTPFRGRSRSNSLLHDPTLMTGSTGSERVDMYKEEKERAKDEERREKERIKAAKGAKRERVQGCRIEFTTEFDRSLFLEKFKEVQSYFYSG